jgi:hypothetical protein
VAERAVSDAMQQLEQGEQIPLVAVDVLAPNEARRS